MAGSSGICPVMRKTQRKHDVTMHNGHFQQESTCHEDQCVVDAVGLGVGADAERRPLGHALHMQHLRNTKYQSHREILSIDQEIIHLRFAC